MAFLELRGIAKRFPSRRGTRQVLVDVDLSVDEGEFVTVVGRSGSGKSTLLAIAAGLVPPDDGEVRLEGRPIAGPGPDRGIVFQGDSLLPWMTVLENVELAAAAVAPGRSRAEHRDRALHFLALVGLEAALGKPPAELSGGMRQRVAVARGLATEPRVLLLDEPFSALDALTRATLQAEVARIWTERRTTVVMITNDLDEAILLGDRICPLVPMAPGEGSTIALDLAIDVPRPRSARTLSLEPGYQAVRRRLVDFLVHRRARPAPGAAAPRPGEAPGALPAAESSR